jgi:proline iminopeptidase
MQSSKRNTKSRSHGGEQNGNLADDKTALSRTTGGGYSSRPGGSPAVRSSTAYATAPPLGITGVLCTSKTIRIADRGTLHYTIYRPRMLQPIKIPPPPRSSSRPAFQFPPPNPPLICVSGGPGIPCQYMASLVHLIPDRAIILFDFMGVGQSSPTNSTVLYQVPVIDGMVQDLEAVVNHALPYDTSSFHLLGHSLGGIVAFEFLKQQLKRKDNHHTTRCCRSIILANAPASIALSHATRRELVAQIHCELQPDVSVRSNAASSLLKSDYDDDIDEEDSHAAASCRAAHRTFQQRHECCVSPMPLMLQQSLTSLKSHIYKEEQYDELNQYMATSTDLDSDQLARLPPALILRGQYDFVSHDNAQAWVEIFTSCQFVTIQNSSHYGMMEAEDLYGDVVRACLQDHDKE